MAPEFKIILIHNRILYSYGETEFRIETDPNWKYLFFDSDIMDETCLRRSRQWIRFNTESLNQSPDQNPYTIQTLDPEFQTLKKFAHGEEADK